jgi:spore germination protein GerM
MKLPLFIFVAIILLGLLGWRFWSSSNQSLTPATRAVSLYYYNEMRDMELATNGEGVACSPQAVLPVSRVIAFTNTPIQDTINELIKGQITSSEVNQGFKTEFPHDDFKLLGANLSDGLLTLEFTEVAGFTGGGSCRVTILANQVIKTAKQFPSVSEVVFKPESLFQP